MPPVTRSQRKSLSDNVEDRIAPVRKVRTMIKEVTPMEIDKPKHIPLKVKAKAKRKIKKPKCKPTTLNKLFAFIKYYSLTKRENDAKAKIIRLINENREFLQIDASVINMFRNQNRVILFLSKHDDMSQICSYEEIQDHLDDIFKYPEVNASLPQVSESIDDITNSLGKTYLQLQTMSCWSS